MYFYKFLNLIIPSTLFFEDGSRIDYLSRNDTLRYISPTGYIFQVMLLYEKTTKKFHVELPPIPKWEKPVNQSLTNEEFSDLRKKISLFISKKKSFVM